MGGVKTLSVPPLAHALAAGTVVLDGGLSTELEARGHDVSGDLWSAVLLARDPDAVRAAHAAFFAAGARVATTASYQATFEGFAAAGLDRRAASWLLRRSVSLAREAADEARAAGLPGPTWVAGSVGPYGALLADGSEYTGAYARAGGMDVAALRRFHRPRMQVLAEAGADVLACETVPALAEVEALVAEAHALAVPVWVALTTVTAPDGAVLTRLGEDASAAFALARDVPEVIAVGVNCTEPAGVARAVEVAAQASGKPVVVYPNSGETWDGGRRTWRGTADFDERAVGAWTAAGARLVGGCCRVSPAQIATIARMLRP
jgi:homocysteine S-methyltransferase